MISRDSDKLQNASRFSFYSLCFRFISRSASSLSSPRRRLDRTRGEMSAMNSMNAFASTSKGNGYAASAGERSEEEEPEELDGRKRKRKRLALSCSECKRRKIKVSDRSELRSADEDGGRQSMRWTRR